MPSLLLQHVGDTLLPMPPFGPFSAYFPSAGDRSGLRLPPHHALTLTVFCRVSDLGLSTTLESTMFVASAVLEVTCRHTTRGAVMADAVAQSGMEVKRGHAFLCRPCQGSN